MKESNPEKYILIGGILVIALIITIAIFLHNKEIKELSAYKTAEIYNNENSKGEIIKTDIDLFKEIRDSEKVSIIYIGRPTCSACVKYYPILEEVAKEYNIDIYYTDTDEWKSTDVNNVLAKALTKFEGTPTTLIMYKRKQANVKVGYMKKDELVKFLKDNKLIRE